MNPDRIYLSPPDVGALEEEYVVRALRSGWVAPLGPEVDAFEIELAERVGTSYAVALSSGTAALHLALLTVGVGKGDVVLTSTFTFAATANAIAYTGAEPYFIDSEPRTGNIDPQLVERALQRLSKTGARIGAIVPVDLFGKAVDYTSIEALAAQYGVPVIGDAAESLGATHAGRPAGSFGRASAISFNGNKVMTTSGGGALLTDDLPFAQHVSYLATQARQPAAHYEHTDIGYNYRLSNLLAALGRAQLSRLDHMIERRRELRDIYARTLGVIDGVEVLGRTGDEDDNCWLTTIIVDAEQTGWAAADLGDALTARNIECRPLWKPMHLQPVFGGAQGEINGTAQALFEQGLALPSGSALHELDRARVGCAVQDFLDERARA